MKEIKIKVNDVKKFNAAFNNAIIALNEIYIAAFLNVSMPYKFEQFIQENNLTKDEYSQILKEKLELLTDVYNQVSILEFNA